jgi:hypothetical protein
MVRIAAKPDDRERSDEPFLSVRDRKRVALAPGAAVTAAMEFT